ncbi:hypothetical protein GC105_14335 [Alkalibaculum sp. M08DMB]|uniref:Uncharacterized protein n=1 Tax=Alkalibaculum sporogenes TaxID=2655001 RepID=A0A6A7KBN9_9FIRM|nr:hypothetical protein [Alkalibaculum sporogenes]MPW26960.1 hypothetical protein [Alkalibaculum sporogenes]
MEENSNNTGFNKGFLMAVIGWLVTIITMPLALTLVQEGRIDFDIFIDPLFLVFFLLYGALLLIIWGPAAWIISKAYRKKGTNKALLLTVAVYVISILVFFGCTGAL